MTQAAALALVIGVAGCGGSHTLPAQVPYVPSGTESSSTTPSSTSTITSSSTTIPTPTPIPVAGASEPTVRGTQSLTGTVNVTITKPPGVQSQVQVVYSNGTTQQLPQSTTLHVTGKISIIAVNSPYQGVMYAPSSTSQTFTVYPFQTVQATVSYTPNAAATQAWRVNAIINRAYQDNGRYVAIECKPWVSRVVLAATGITVPPTTDSGNGWKWLYSPYFDVVPGGISAARRGDIVQMNITKDSPHTFIVVNVYANGTMDVIESNYTAHDTVMARPNSTKPAPITFASIQRYYAYTVYRMNGNP